MHIIIICLQSSLKFVCSCANQPTASFFISDQSPLVQDVVSTNSDQGRLYCTHQIHHIFMTPHKEQSKRGRPVQKANESVHPLLWKGSLTHKDSFGRSVTTTAVAWVYIMVAKNRESI